MHGEKEHGFPERLLAYRAYIQEVVNKRYAVGQRICDFLKNMLILSLAFHIVVILERFNRSH